jgi:hypothetical protein
VHVYNNIWRVQEVTESQWHKRATFLQAKLILQTLQHSERREQSKTNYFQLICCWLITNFTKKLRQEQLSFSGLAMAVPFPCVTYKLHQRIQPSFRMASSLFNFLYFLLFDLGAQRLFPQAKSFPTAFLPSFNSKQPHFLIHWNFQALPHSFFSHKWFCLLAQHSILRDSLDVYGVGGWENSLKFIGSYRLKRDNACLQRALSLQKKTDKCRKTSNSRQTGQVSTVIRCKDWVL